ncbi:hypothetical protein D3OALGA1CA_1315 [Olavius algarvensis associated proteobacterium Delta 3]|nr:hypothetical protein D3OALGB2SA_613 [Olavius algarvensis associated proteobacterium Delta 3]CAB5099074.1 hypothetical protein D3OALGA1CA_1315 [Olavius algarvensis associated proteobacterium Delta 3]
MLIPGVDTDSEREPDPHDPGRLLGGYDAPTVTLSCSPENMSMDITFVKPAERGIIVGNTY